VLVAFAFVAGSPGHRHMRSPSAIPIIEAMPRSAASRGSILVVDDEPTIAEVVARYLDRAGYETRIASDGPSAVAAALDRRPDLIVLDIMLPGFDGLEVMRRTNDALEGGVPVILLTAKGEQSDRVVGLRLGADDYVVKPFAPAELVARVDAVLRRVRPGGETAEALRFGELEINPGARSVRMGGREVELTQREFDLLLFLARHPGQVFNRDQLMDRVWQFSFYTDTTTVTVHIRRLRSKIEPDPSRPVWIETVWGVGYRFRPERR
jgi:two-component system, OmpR family, response regulator ResD